MVLIFNMLNLNRDRVYNLKGIECLLKGGCVRGMSGYEYHKVKLSISNFSKGRNL